uniref:LCP family protein n=1 Tax=Eubacterium cellulosolvens TaxID=29322 RepID=UPI000684074A|nr:LCP family protein [[Eubacterium] cellulosolvens]
MKHSNNDNAFSSPSFSADTDSIRVAEYDAGLTVSSGHPASSYRSNPDDGSEEHLNYYQRMQREKQRAAGRNAQESVKYSDLPEKKRRDSAGDTSLKEDTPLMNLDTDFDLRDPGDTYDFGLLSPGKKKKKTDDIRKDRKSDPEDRKDLPRKKKRKHSLRRGILAVVLVFAALFAAFMLFLLAAFNRLNRTAPVADAQADVVTKAAGVSPYREAGVMNILLIGQDARNGETQTRSDSMIIASLNVKKRQITLTSLMRDMYVPISGFESNKLNAAFAYGGMETIDETIQEQFGIDIDGNAVVDFNGFLEALTSVGDLEIELSYEEADYLNQNPALGENNDRIEGVTWDLSPGVNSLTPKQALAYSRMRYVGNSDWDRVNRQKKVIQAAFSKLKHNPFKLMHVMNEAAPSITTDMSNGYLYRAFFYALFCGTEMRTYTIPGEGEFSAEMVDGMSVLLPDLPACRESLINIIYGDGTADTVDTNVSPVQHNDDGSPGYDGGDTGNSPVEGDYDGDGYPDSWGDNVNQEDADGDGIPDVWGNSW